MKLTLATHASKGGVLFDFFNNSGSGNEPSAEIFTFKGLENK